MAQQQVGPQEGLNRLRHPDCRFCAEHERLTQGEIVKNRQLREKLAQQVEAELHSEADGTTALAGRLGDAIADEAGMCSLEFVSPEQLATGIARWLRTGGA